MPLLASASFGPRLRGVVRRIASGLLRLLFDYECRGQEHVPVTGAAVIASNHPSYLDGVLLSVSVRRPIRFIAWDKLFKVPVVGFLLRSFGAFPVSSTPGQGHVAFETAKSLVAAGKVVGVFPEGKRSQAARMELAVRSGAARLAYETGAPLVPATISGAYRAWPHFQSLPRPARIRVRFHPPIEPGAYRHLPENEAVVEMLSEWRRRVDRSLKPGAKADVRKVGLYERPAPAPRFHELALALTVSGVLLLRSGSLWYQAVPLAYALYLFADWRGIPQRRRVKWLRNTSPLLFMICFGPSVLEALRLPEVPAAEALGAMVLGAVLPYFYERASVALQFMRGLVMAALLDLAALLVAPSGLGPHVALTLYAAGFAGSQRTVFWRYAVPFQALYALGATWYMGGQTRLWVHFAAGAVACLVTLLWPYRPPARHERRPVDEDDFPVSAPPA